MRDKITVLYVDEAVSFGGSVVVIGYLVQSLNKDRFRTVVAGEMDASILKNLIQGDAALYIIPHAYNYVRWGNTVKDISNIPGRVPRKLAIYLMSVWRSLANTTYIVKMAWLILKENVDIIHINNGMTNVAVFMAAILTRRRYVVHLHQIKEPGFLQRLLIKTVPKFIVISEYIKKGMQKQSVPGERMVVIPNPVKPRRVIPSRVEDVRQQYGIKEGDLVFGIVGRIVRWKGHVEFLAAARIVLGKAPNSKVLIVGDLSDGDAEYQREIIRLVEESGFRDRIIFTGYVADVETMYAIMDIFIHASIGPEPFGLVITEAMAYGVLVIASDRGAPVEIITDGENGFLVDPTDTEKLAGTILSLLEDEALRCRIGEKGRQRVLSDYRVDAYATAVGNVYQDVLDVNAMRKRA